MTNCSQVRTVLRETYQALQLSRHQQIGLRALRDAEQLEATNPNLADMRLQTAVFHLPFARSARR